MSLNRILEEDIEYFTLETNVHRTFSSSSVGVISGNLRIFPRGSSVEKEVQALSPFSASMFSDIDINEYIRLAQFTNTATSSIGSYLEGYMRAVNAAPSSTRKQQTVEILRFEPSFQLTSDTQRKLNVVNGLMKYYRPTCPTGHFNYTNYNTLNFFTSSNTPASSVIMYPNSGTNELPLGPYALSGAFSFDFWINPRYTNDLRLVGGNYSPAHFKAGTILHLSSCYAVSLISGSLKSPNGLAEGFRIQLQLSHSADIRPSEVSSAGNYPRNLVFLSDDNSLTKNNWHHITIRWGTNTYNNGTGSFIIDGQNKGNFVVPSGTVMPNTFSATSDPEILFLGNYYEGTNTGTATSALFFTTDVANRDGIMELADGTEEAPNNFTLNHPLNAEIHEIKIYKKYLNNVEIARLDTNAPENLNDISFYVPPFFTEEAPYRKFVGDHGGILVTPFFERSGSTRDPFNVEFSYGVGGHYINLENFTKDFAQGTFPRLLFLTASALTGSEVVPLTADAYLYKSGSNIKRNLTILPCDNGRFFPNYDMLKNGSRLLNLTTRNMEVATGTLKYRNDLGNADYGSIYLRDLAATSSYRSGIVFPSGSIVDDMVGATPENLSANPGQILTILQRTRDNTSNQVCFFDVSNLYYGNQIKPGSLVLRDINMTGSQGKVSITLKDDGEGNIYRDDCGTEACTWNSVGNIYYSEGIIMLKSPHLYPFGRDQFEMSFQGSHNLHILSLNLAARSGMITSSSNPSYVAVSASANANENEKRFVYITSMNIMDENMNVVAKTAFAQPIVKKASEKFLFKTKIDY